MKTLIVTIQSCATGERKIVNYRAHETMVIYQAHKLICKQNPGYFVVKTKVIR